MLWVWAVAWIPVPLPIGLGFPPPCSAPQLLPCPTPTSEDRRCRKRPSRELTRTFRIPFRTRTYSSSLSATKMSQPSGTSGTLSSMFWYVGQILTCWRPGPMGPHCAQRRHWAHRAGVGPGTADGPDRCGVQGTAFGHFQVMGWGHGHPGQRTVLKT